jgi:uncharacterized protein YjbJ (UPF0337 family)
MLMEDFFKAVDRAFAAQRSKTVNNEQVSGRVEQVVGTVKQKVRETLGNERLTNQGVVDRARSAARETWGNANNVAPEGQQSHKTASLHKTDERRNKTSQSVQKAKDKAKEKIGEFKERHSA